MTLPLGHFSLVHSPSFTHTHNTFEFSSFFLLCKGIRRWILNFVFVCRRIGFGRYLFDDWMTMRGDQHEHNTQSNNEIFERNDRTHLIMPCHAHLFVYGAYNVIYNNFVHFYFDVCNTFHRPLSVINSEFSLFVYEKWYKKMCIAYIVFHSRWCSTSFYHWSLLSGRRIVSGFSDGCV